MSDYEMEDGEYQIDDEYTQDEGYNQIEETAGEYEFLKKDGFEKKRDEQIEEFVEYSSLPKEEAEIVLICYQWNFEKLSSVWYENLDNNKIKCGIERSKESLKKDKYPYDGNCPICYGELENDKIGLKCGHLFCKDCYTEYLKTRLEDPLTVIASPCPNKGCNLIVTSDIFAKCLKSLPDEWNKYTKFLLKDYTEANSDIKWCPNPHCGLCIRVPGHGVKEIKCMCGTVFCFKCLRETHRPCDCEMISQWEKKNNSNSENVKWLLLNTKQCPNCHKYIEKNQGCNHMVCRKEAGGCGYEFCWICLGEWKKHGTSWYKCNFKKEDDVENEKKKLANTKFELERYVNYFEQYMNHNKAQELAVKLQPKIEKYKEEFSERKHVPFLELQFLTDAINTIIDCRRMLKNSYVFGYYLKKCKEIALFEHNQSLMDSNTDRLHEMMEKNESPDLLEIGNIEEFNSAFISFRNRVINLMGSITTYKSNLLDEIENKMINLINYKALNKTD